MSIPGSLTPLFSTGSGGAAGYQVSRSLRFNSSDSAYLSRTPAVAGNRTKWTWAGWVKKGGLTGVTGHLWLMGGGTSGSNSDDIYFNAGNSTVDDRFVFASYYGSSQFTLELTRKFRDPSAWYHIVIAVNTTIASPSSDRVKIYVNGEVQTDFATANYPSQNFQFSYFNNTSENLIGSSRFGSPGNYFSGSLADIHFIDGQALTPSSFTEVSATTGQLIPKTYSGSYGLVADSTGALPLFNTTGAQGAVKDTGTRTDAYSSYISLALPMDGTNGGTSFGDQSAVIRGSGSAKTVTVTNPTTSTSQSKFYGSSGFFNNNGYLSIPYSSDVDLSGSGTDFTIETWIYRTTSDEDQIFEFRGNAGSTGLTLYVLSNNTIQVYDSSAGAQTASSGTISLNAWVHIAVTKNGSNCTYWINGSNAGTFTRSSFAATDATGVRFGASKDPVPNAAYLSGYLQDLRIYKGVAKYTSNFIVPTPNSFQLKLADNSAATAATLGKDTSGNSNNWTPNNLTATTNPVYSNSVTEVGGQVFYGGGSAKKVFDGDIINGNDNYGTTGNTPSNTNCIRATFTTPSTNVTSLRVYGAGNSSFTCKVWYNNDESTKIDILDPVGWKTFTLGSPITLSSLSWGNNASSNGGMNVRAIEVNGTILVDGVPSNIDSLVDTPTSYGTDTGVGGEVRGNYATLNPLDKATTSTLADGNIQASSGNAWSMVRSTIGVSSGKWYWECNIVSGNNNLTVGIAKNAAALANIPGGDANGWGYVSTGLKWTNGSGSAYGASFAAGNVIGIAFDADNGTLTFYKDNTTQGQAFSGLTNGPYFPALATESTTAWINFGQRAFAYTAPSGFKALCDTNLGAPLVAKPNTLMDVVLYTGTGAALTPTSSLGFNPDWIWIKSRSAATDHALYDVVRGAQARLESNTADAEVTTDGGVTAFNSAGFTLGTLAQVNTSSATYAAWCWDAGTSTVSNTAGSITSQVRANVSAGFSVITWTGAGTINATVGHGLGVAPKLRITKNRTTGGTGWPVHTTVIDGSLDYLFLNSTAAKGNSSENIDTSTVFSVHNSTDYGASGQNFVTYAFTPVAGYSSFGSYVGNGLLDGPFVYTGFRPRWVMIKPLYSYDGGGSTVASTAWYIYDSARGSYNGNGAILGANNSYSEENNATDIDFLSNGFKLRNQRAVNTSNGAIYAAFAESPFQYARAR